MKQQKPFQHGPWSGVRTVSDPYEETPGLLYDALNCTIPDPGKGSGVNFRPAITLSHDPKTGRVGQGMISHITANGNAITFVVRGGKFELLSATLAAPTFVDWTPTNVQIDPTARVFLTSFAGVILVNDGVNVPWVYDPASLTATRISYSTPVTSLSRGAPDTTVAVASTIVTLAGVTTTRSSSGVAIAGTVTTTFWGIFRVSVNSAGTFTVTNAGATQGYATEAAAKLFLPDVPAGQWDCGYFAVRAAGSNWVGGTDALQGGASGTPATTTNYYAPAYTSWTATGPAVVYSAQAVWVLSSVAGVSSTASITWSEIASPLTGYDQSAFDNTWALTQTSPLPVTGLAPTNSGLYAFRKTHITEITGAISRVWRTEATTDAVSTTVGTSTPASILVTDQYIWFTSDDGLPHRFAIGSRVVEPLWLNLRDIVTTVRSDALLYSTVTARAVTAYQPDLKKVVMALWGGTTSVTATTLYGFDAITGTYEGRWTTGRGVDTLGVLQEYTGKLYLCMLGPSDASTTAQAVATRGAMCIQRLTTDVNASVPMSDDGTTAMQASITSSMVAGDAGTNKRFDRLRVRIRAALAALAGRSRQFLVTMDTPWGTGIGGLTPVLSDGVAEDRTIICGLATTARWVRFTISGPVVSGDLLTESGDFLTTESGLRIAVSGSDTPFLGPVSFEGLEVTARAVGQDRSPR